MTGYGYRETFQRQIGTEKAYLFNTALDVAYIAGGLYLRERGRPVTENGDRLTGFGNSIILQGSFLFVYDLILYLVHTRHGRQLLYDAEKISFYMLPGYAGAAYRF